MMQQRPWQVTTVNRYIVFLFLEKQINFNYNHGVVLVEGDVCMSVGVCGWVWVEGVVCVSVVCCECVSQCVL